MNTSALSSAPSDLVATMVAAQMVGAGGGADGAAAMTQAGDSLAISAQALAMLEAEQSAMASTLTASA